MHFEVEHHLRGSVESIAERLASADFYTSLDLPDLSKPSVIDETTAGDTRTLALRYEFVGHLDPLARRMLGRHALAWEQEVTVDVSAGCGELRFASTAAPRSLHGAARFDLVPEPTGCVRRLRGEVVVSVPLIGARAEAKIVPGVIRRLDIEAEALSAG